MHVSHEGQRLYYEKYGKGRKELVFLHGIMMSSAVWAEQLPEFQRDHTVYCFDLRGFGHSDKPEMNYTAETFVADTRHMIETLDIKSPIVVGWSMGGAVAMVLAAMHPGLVRSLVLVGTSPSLLQQPDFAPAVPAEAAAQLAQMLEENYATGCMAFCDLMFPEPDAAEKKRFVYSITQQTTPYVALTCMQNVGGADLRPFLKDIRAPVAVICGEDDRLCPIGASEYLANNLNARRFERIPDAGHASFLTRPTEFNAALRRALETL